jgi:hypothetical protein
MSDLAFVVAAYGVVLGGLSAYIVSIGRRARAARRTVEALERARDQALPDVRGEPPPTLASTPEARR